MKNGPLLAIDKELRNSNWFKKNAHHLIEQIDNLLEDQSFSETTVRLSLLLLANIHSICKGSGDIKNYLKNGQTFEKIESLFENFTDQWTGKGEEMQELRTALRCMFSSKEVERLMQMVNVVEEAQQTEQSSNNTRVQ